MTDQELRALVANLALAQQKADERLARNDDRLTKVKAVLAEIALSQNKIGGGAHLLFR